MRTVNIKIVNFKDIMGEIGDETEFRSLLINLFVDYGALYSEVLVTYHGEEDYEDAVASEDDVEKFDDEESSEVEEMIGFDGVDAVLPDNAVNDDLDEDDDEPDDDEPDDEPDDDLDVYTLNINGVVGDYVIVSTDGDVFVLGHVGTGEQIKLTTEELKLASESVEN